MKRLFSVFGTTYLLFAALQSVQAQSLIPIERFTNFQRFSAVSISPNGRYLAAIVPAQNRRRLVVLDLNDKSVKSVANYNDIDIRDARWISNNRLVFWTFDLKSGLGEQTRDGFFAIDKNGENRTALYEMRTGRGDYAGRKWQTFEFIKAVGPDSPEIYASSYFRSRGSVDLYRLNTLTGDSVLLSVEPPKGHVISWVQKPDGTPIAATTVELDTGQVTVHTIDANSKWQARVEFQSFEQGWIPLEYFADERGEALAIKTNLGRDKTAIARFDLTKNRIAETMAEHPEFDLGWPEDRSQSVRSATFIRVNGRVVGIRFHAEKEQTIWFDEKWQKWQNSVDAVRKKYVNQLQPIGDTGRVLVFSYSDKQPGEFFQFDSESLKLTSLLSVNPGIDETTMAERRFIRYKARDGRVIAAYVTIPEARASGPLPLIVLPHGGPQLRAEYWGWEAQSQFFASRGYLVVQPEFRGTRGFGFDHFRAGFKQWGLAMQDDLADAVEHLAEIGLADKSKVCIVGASYGGYAASMGVVKAPDLYRCAINIVGVTASEYMHSIFWSDFGRSKSAEVYLNNAIGNPSTDRAILDAGNAVKQVSKIKAPILMIYGLQDKRVPIEHGERLRDALAAAGKKFEWVVYKDEAHGFLLPSNRRDQFERMEKFLAEHLK